MSNDSHGELVKESVDGGEDVHQHALPRRSLRGLVLGTLLAVVCVLALALGLGLGLGLKHHHHSTSDSSSGALPSLLPTSENNFRLDGLAGQTPQTRVFNFTISQVEGAPDGVSKPMLVVNGE